MSSIFFHTSCQVRFDHKIIKRKEIFGRVNVASHQSWNNIKMKSSYQMIFISKQWKVTWQEHFHTIKLSGNISTVAIAALFLKLLKWTAPFVSYAHAHVAIFQHCPSIKIVKKRQAKCTELVFNTQTSMLRIATCSFIVRDVTCGRNCDKRNMCLSVQCPPEKNGEN